MKHLLQKLILPAQTAHIAVKYNHDDEKQTAQQEHIKNLADKEHNRFTVSERCMHNIRISLKPFSRPVNPYRRNQFFIDACANPPIRKPFINTR
jgi:hypothetical protein